MSVQQPPLWEQPRYAVWHDPLNGYYVSDARPSGKIPPAARLLEAKNIRFGENGYFPTQVEAEQRLAALLEVL